MILVILVYLFIIVCAFQALYFYAEYGLSGIIGCISYILLCLVVVYGTLQLIGVM